MKEHSAQNKSKRIRTEYRHIKTKIFWK